MIAAVKTGTYRQSTPKR